MTGPGWAEHALGELLDRVGRTRIEVGDRFPLYAATTGEPWRTTSRGSWAGGFWAGLLAVRAAVSGTGGDLAAAVAARDRLAGWAGADTVCRGLIFWYGETGHHLGLMEPSEAPVAAARAMAGSFTESLGAIPWGTAFGGVKDAVRPDGAAGAVPLLAWSARRPGGPEHGVELAARHLGTHLRQAPSDWPRGRAWLLMACVDAVRWVGPEYLAPARRLADGWVPVAGDSSADCIAAVALIRLGGLDATGGWHEAGVRLLRGTVVATQIGAGPARGGIGGGSYDTATDREVVWGDFFAAIGLGLLTGAIGDRCPWSPVGVPAEEPAGRRRHVQLVGPVEDPRGTGPPQHPR